MRLLGGFRIGRWFGFPIRIDYSWFPVAAFVIWTFSAREFPRVLPAEEPSTYLGMGVVAAVLFFLSVLLHELGHAVIGRVRGVTVESITLFFFGGIAQAREEPRRPMDEFLLTAAGPVTSFLLAGVFQAARLAAEGLGAAQPVIVVLGFLAFLNLVLAIFNLIPGFPLDGGRIFRSIVWAATGDLVRATRWATWGGRLFGGALIALGLYSLSQGQLVSGLWSAFIGWFLVNAASSSLRHFELRQLLHLIPVSRVMTSNPRKIDASLSIDRAIAQYFMLGRQEAYPVELDGVLIGIVDLSKVADVPPALRAETRVSDVMRPTYELTSVGPDDSLADVMSRPEPVTASLVVVEGGQVVGLLDLGEVSVWARRMQRLGLISLKHDGADDAGRLSDSERAGGGLPRPAEGAF